MSDENPETPEQEEPPATASAQPKEPVFTQAEVDAIASKARSQGLRKGRKEGQAMAQQPQTQDAPPAPVDDEPPAWATSIIESTAELKAKLAANETAAAYAEATAGVQLSEEESAMAPTLYEHNRPAFDALIARKKAADQPPEAKGPGFASPGAPAAAPRAPDVSAPSSWTQDDIAVMQREGTFLQNLKNYRRSMSGGGAFFPAKDPFAGKGK